MKKIITLAIFTFALVLGTQSVNGQNPIEINKIAAEKTKQLKQYVKLSDQTVEDQVYATFQEYERKKYGINQMIAAGEAVPEKDMLQLENMLTDKFKELFTPEQLERYLNGPGIPR